MGNKRKGGRKDGAKESSPPVKPPATPKPRKRAEPMVLREPAATYAPAPRRAQKQGIIPAAHSGVVYLSSTDAQNGFGALLDTVARGRTVMITKHSRPEAVVMSFDRYEALTRDAVPELDTLEDEFDAMVAQMQTPEARAARSAAFHASPEELGAAAVEYARRNAEGR